MNDSGEQFVKAAAGPDGADMLAEARAMATGVARRIDREDLAADAALIVSELVTNALLHGDGCAGVDIRPIEGGLRMEVRDRSPVPPVPGHAAEGALTGRGVRVVATLATRWGVQARADGKVVWAELTGRAVRAGGSLIESRSLTMPRAEVSPAGARRYRVELGDVPTDLLLAAKSHVDNVVREFELAAAGAGAGTTKEVPPRVLALLGAVNGFGEARNAIKRQALDAVRLGQESTHLVLELSAGAADAAEGYLEALDEIDGYCRAARLLTLETPPQHKVFRTWYVQEVAVQLRALRQGLERPPPQPFQRRLLAELDQVAAAQRASERTARLYSVAAALAKADTPEAVAAAVLNEGVAALGASGGGLLLATDAEKLSLPGAVGYEEAVVARLRVESRDAELPAAVALRTGEAVWLESRAQRDLQFPDLVGLEAATASLCAVPLEVLGRRMGALRFSFTEPRLFDADERSFVLALAAQTAQALYRTQLQAARSDVSRRLQRSLLPPALPEIPGLDVAAIYRPFGDGVEVGGDFYDMWAISPDRWAVAIGDAAGTGPEAAALTAVARHTMRALTISNADPIRTMRNLNTALCNSAVEEDDRFMTALFGVITIGDDIEVALSGGGHPPVMVRRADGTSETVHVGGSLLGVLDVPEVGTETIHLHPGDTAVLVTDGVLEARREGRQFDVEGVEAVLAAQTGSAMEIVSALEVAVRQHTGGVLSDDMAAVVLHRPSG